MAKEKPTIKQHYIPRFILRNFCTDGRMQVADLSGGEVRCFPASPESMCFEKDLYETINPDGTYYQRNELEDKFADMEGGSQLRLRRYCTKAKILSCDLMVNEMLRSRYYLHCS